MLQYKRKIKKKKQENQNSRRCDDRSELYVCERAPENRGRQGRRERERKRGLKDTAINKRLRESILEGNALKMYKPGCLWWSTAQGSERKGTNQEPKLHKEGPWIN